MADSYRKCPQCAEEVKAEAIKCKHCGSNIEQTNSTTYREEWKKVPPPLRWGFILIMVIVAVNLFPAVSDFSSSKSTDVAKAEPVRQPEKNATGKYYMSTLGLGCATESLYERAFSMMNNDEWEAVAELVASGRCVRIEKGVRVHIEDSSWSAVKVRPTDSTQAYWTTLGLPVER